MPKQISIRLLPSEAADDQIVRQYIAQSEGIALRHITGYNIIKKSIDARGKQPWINLTLQVFIQEQFTDRQIPGFNFPSVQNAKRQVLIIGMGPAGLFAALKLIEAGIKPVILERGKDVRARRRDLAVLNKEGKINPESNYCFGEGGAGTYSDGKLYTRSSKRGDVQRILSLFVYFGAEEQILYEAHPHIGTNKLPGIITAMRKQILDCGGEIHFEKAMTDLIVKNGEVVGIETKDKDRINGDAVILATGHSARDVFSLLHQNGIQIEAKPFALGVRVEHPQSLIDQAQYHQLVRDPFLPPSSYSLVQQVNGKGVFSFCMCPGGIIAPASTSAGELVVNGWSPSKRNNPFANSGMVVTVENKDLAFLRRASDFEDICQQPVSVLNGPLSLMYFQQYVERKAYMAGGGGFVAPAQRMVDFSRNRVSRTLPDCSYLPGVSSVSLSNVLPPFISKRLGEALKVFDTKVRGYFTNEAILVATESRTSSPVRIPRDNHSLQHTQIRNLYPCGEGAGYAGGIVSAAMDGENIATQIAKLHLE